MTAEPFYWRELERGAEVFRASESTRGPWSADHQHAGPPAGLIARAIVRHGPLEMFPVRSTFELLRPIPIASRLSIEIETLSAGRSVDRLRASLLDADGPLVVANVLRVRQRALAVPSFDHQDLDDIAPIERSVPFDFPFFRHERGYHTAMELRIAAGRYGRGAMAAWIRPRIDLVEGEATDPIARVMICADAGHGVGAGLDTNDFSFINPDLDVHLARSAQGEWICMDAQSMTTQLGVGLCRTRLLDHQGEFGLGVQSQVLRAAGG